MEKNVSFSACLMLSIIIWIRTAAAQSPRLNPGQLFPPGQICPDLMCTLEFIPEACREIPVIQINGKNCTGCPRWKSSCSRTSSLNSNSVCPTLSCPDLNVSEECKLVETYEYNGRLCLTCPKVRSECAARISNTPQITCPSQACPLIFIPDECREIPTFDFTGLKCDKCPIWRSGCTPARPFQTNLFPQPPPSVQRPRETHCPTIACDSYVPSECQLMNEYRFEGKLCERCPTWRVGCREPERQAQMANPSFGSTVPASPIDCPTFTCSSIKIAANCLELQPFEYRGKTCYRCPRWREGCLPSNPINSIQTQFPETPCPLIRCESLNVPSYCLQQETYKFNGRMCDSCPTVKQECRALLQPTPLAALTTQREVQCPSRRCPLLYIPKECMEMETFQFEGKACEGCPRYKKGCTPSAKQDSSIQTNGSTFTKHTAITVECPKVGCPKLNIPPECKIEQPYQFQGKTCYGCPKRKINCSVNMATMNSNQVISPEAECPLLKCNRMYIPPECREVESFDFQGRTCYMCPKFKKGCIPGGNQGELATTNTLANLVSAKKATRPLDILTNEQPDLPCPVLNCPNYNLSAECFEKKPYQFMGKTCFKCPILIPNCLSNQNTNTGDKVCPELACPKVTIPSDCVEITTYEMNGVICPNCPKRINGCVGETELKIDQHGSRIPGTYTACPLLECIDGGIPKECIELQPYQVEGRTCYKCPIWRTGCSPTVPIGMQNNQNSEYPPEVKKQLASIACPLFDCKQEFGTIPVECQEHVTYMFMGLKQCNKCPVQRPFCSSGVKNRGTDIQQGLLAFSGSGRPTQTHQTNEMNEQSRASQPSQPSQVMNPVEVVTVAPSIADLNGVIPVGRVMSVVQAALCPNLPCPTIAIPAECRESRSYMYNGIRCEGCPTWRQNCRPGVQGRRPNLNMNGIIAYSLFNEMMLRR